MEFGSACAGPPATRLVERAVDGHVTLYDPESTRVHVLNGTATDTWLLCDGEHTAEQIVVLLARAYRVDAEDIRSSVIGTVDLFRRERLLGGEDGAS